MVIKGKIDTKDGQLLYTGSGDGILIDAPDELTERKERKINPDAYLSDCGLVGRAALYLVEASPRPNANIEPANIEDIAI